MVGGPGDLIGVRPGWGSGGRIALRDAESVSAKAFAVRVIRRRLRDTSGHGVRKPRLRVAPANDLPVRVREEASMATTLNELGHKRPIPLAPIGPGLTFRIRWIVPEPAVAG